MKKIILFIAAVTLSHSFAFSQACLPQGITFSNQAQIDNFQTNYPGCTVIEGNVTIQGSNITNLNGLSVLTFIGGDVKIINNNLLTSLAGLEGLDSIGGSLTIGINAGVNNALINLTGLENLTSIGGSLVIDRNNALASLSGLENLATIGGNLSIGTFGYGGNSSLASLSGLEGLTAIMGYLSICENNSLVSLDALNNLSFIGGNLIINGNSSLQACNAGWLCALLSNTGGSVFIDYNAPGCNTVIEIAYSCGGLPCLPHGDYSFRSQMDIDHFAQAFPGCTGLAGNVKIDGSDISNLAGLSQVTAIGGTLFIGTRDYFPTNPDLTDLTGLEVLTSIGGSLIVAGNPALLSLAGLDNLSSIAGDLKIGFFEWTTIAGNPSLISLEGMMSLTSIGGGILIIDNNSLTSLTGLDNIISIGGYLSIADNDALTSLTGLDNITSIGGSLGIGINNALTSLTGLDNITSIGGSLEIGSNNALASLTGLEGLISIGWEEIRIEDNSALASLSGIDYIAAGSIANLNINYNFSLSTCEVQSICNYLAAPNGTVSISNNAPGCNSRLEVEDACGLVGVPLVDRAQPEIICYPNPSGGISHFVFHTSQYQWVSLKIYDVHGREVAIAQDGMLPAGEHNIGWNMDGLPVGIYYFRLQTDNRLSTGKLMKL